MDEFLKSLPSLLGVLIGGLITFAIQQITIRKQQKWDREKIELDKFYKNEERKFQAYNKILQLHGKHAVVYINQYTGEADLDNSDYNEHIRPILFEIFHLLDSKVAKQVNFIEDVFERQFIMEEAETADQTNMGRSYLKIIQYIKEEFNNLRRARDVN